MSYTVTGIGFGNAPWLDRLAWAVALVSFGLAGLIGLGGSPAWVTALMFAATLFIVVEFSTFRYTNDPGVKKLRQLVGQTKEAVREAVEAGRKVLQREAELKKLLDDLDAREAGLQAAIAAARTQEKQALATSAQALVSEKTRLQRERDQAQRDRDSGLQRARDRVARAVADLDRQTAGLVTEEAAERNRVLSQMQKEHIMAELRAARVLDTDIYDEDLSLKELQSMYQQGGVTAADINGIEAERRQRKQALLARRRSVEARAERTKPTAINPAEEQAIREQFERRRTALVAKRTKEQASLTSEEQAVQSAYQQAISRLYQDESAQHGQADARENQARAQARTAVEEAEGKLRQLLQERQSAGVTQARRRCGEAHQAQALATGRKAWLEYQVALGRSGLTIRGYVKRVLGFA
jgi:hypothetical protein